MTMKVEPTGQYKVFIYSMGFALADHNRPRNSEPNGTLKWPPYTKTLRNRCMDLNICPQRQTLLFPKWSSRRQYGDPANHRLASIRIPPDITQARLLHSTPLRLRLNLAMRFIIHPQATVIMVIIWMLAMKIQLWGKMLLTRGRI